MQRLKRKDVLATGIEPKRCCAVERPGAGQYKRKQTKDTLKDGPAMRLERPWSNFFTPRIAMHRAAPWRAVQRVLLGLTLTACALSAQAADAPVILVLGDSISAEYGLPRDSGWVKLLGARLHQGGLAHQVVNASISGETTSGGASRLPALLTQHSPQIVIIALGGNDGLRGLDPAVTEQNLQRMVAESKRLGARVLLVGIRVPPNYGRDYANRFAAIFTRVAQRNRVALVKYFFEGFAQTDEYFQADRIHPTVRAQTVLLDNVWGELKQLLPRRGVSG